MKLTDEKLLEIMDSVYLNYDPLSGANSVEYVFARAIEAEVLAPYSKPSQVLNGMNPLEFLGNELFDFQEATGCDTAEEFKKQAGEPVAEVHPSHLLPTTGWNPHWCREVLLYSGNNPGDFLDGKNTRVKLYTTPQPVAPVKEPNPSYWCDNCKSYHPDTTPHVVQTQASEPVAKVISIEDPAWPGMGRTTQTIEWLVKPETGAFLFTTPHVVQTQEPVAEKLSTAPGCINWLCKGSLPKDGTKLYTSPQPVINQRVSMNILELSGADLDKKVAICEEEDPKLHTPYSTEWTFGGPIIEREQIQIGYCPGGEWRAEGFNYSNAAYGPTPLMAAMRCYVYNTIKRERDLHGK